MLVSLASPEGTTRLEEASAERGTRGDGANAVQRDVVASFRRQRGATACGLASLAVLLTARRRSQARSGGRRGAEEATSLGASCPAEPDGGPDGGAWFVDEDDVYPLAARGVTDHNNRRAGPGSDVAAIVSEEKIRTSGMTLDQARALATALPTTAQAVAFSPVGEGSAAGALCSDDAGSEAVALVSGATPPATTAIAPGAAPVPAPAGGVALQSDPTYAKYFKMLKLGLPLGAVKNAMTRDGLVGRDGLDPSVMDGDHDAPIPGAPSPARDVRDPGGGTARQVLEGPAHLRELATRVLAAPSAREGLVLNYHMSALGQPPFGGHLSPVAAYHGASDSLLVMDVWHTRTEPVWAPVARVWEAILGTDPESGAPRGLLQLVHR